MALDAVLFKEYFARMKTCPQCGASVSEKKAFCAECGGTIMPSPAKARRQQAAKGATTVLTQSSKRKRKQRDEAKSAKRPGVLTIYWKKRKRTDEE
ncbi:MAG: hypothetical protein DMF64_19170 [Acidobacteria bacterium]|nr:MAG: hypothetical protein DMF64_19170 [Acidobacteriota bacterium]